MSPFEFTNLLYRLFSILASHISLKGFSLLADGDGGLIDGHQTYMKVDTWYDKCKLPYYSIFSFVENMSR